MIIRKEVFLKQKYRKLGMDVGKRKTYIQKDFVTVWYFLFFPILTIKKISSQNT